jgi:glycosyltransferase involved in cell wall biosynthesis
MENILLPKVSVIVPYNKNRGWLYDCIWSIVTQDYEGEIEILLSKSNERVGTNINRAVQKATGEYIKFIPEDDMLTPNCIRESVAGIGQFDVIHGNAYYIENGSIVRIAIPQKKSFGLGDMLSKNYVHGGTLFFKRDVLLNEPFDESLWTAEEYELNLRLLKKGYTFGYVDAFMTYNRLHGLQKSIGNKAIEYQRTRMKEIERIKRMYWL